MQHTYNDVKKAVLRSQHCQRNFDLTKTIPEQDIELMIHAATNCPSKQNIAFYKAHFITDPETIKFVHNHTNGFLANKETGHTETNSQTLSNLLIVFEIEDYLQRCLNDHAVRNNETEQFKRDGNLDSENLWILEKDTNMAIGIAAGYVNLTASMLGYATGCCACFDMQPIKEKIGATNVIQLLMGVGYKNEDVNRRVHPETGFVFPTKTKQQITVNRIN